MPNVSPVKYTTAFTMRVDQEFLDAVEELRRLQTSIPSKSDVIRDLVMEALRRSKTKGIKPKPNRETIAAMKEARRGGLRSHRNVKALRKSLNADD